MKATDLLKMHHQEMNQLFEEIEQAAGEEARSLCDELASKLVAHSLIEKEIFYPACKETHDGIGRLHEAYEEHALVELALQKLLNAAPGDESFHAKVMVLKEVLQHHVEEEEATILPDAERILGDEQMQELGARMEQQFEMIQAGNVKTLLAQAIVESMPPLPAMKRTTRKAPQPSRAKRAPARAATSRSKAGSRQGAATRGKSSRAESGRTNQSRTKPSRAAQTSRGGNSQSSASRGGRTQRTSRSATR